MTRKTRPLLTKERVSEPYRSVLTVDPCPRSRLEEAFAAGAAAPPDSAGAPADSAEERADSAEAPADSAV